MAHQLTGKVFGRLTVLGPDESNRRNWKCQCTCGNIKVARDYNLMRKHTQSCGCLFTEYVQTKRTTHGLSKLREHAAWQAMIGRCYNPNHPSYAYFGELGIEVCERWRFSFQNFYNDVGPRPSSVGGKKSRYELRRPDATQNFEPGNCTWLLTGLTRRSLTRHKEVMA